MIKMLSKFKIQIHVLLIELSIFFCFVEIFGETVVEKLPIFMDFNPFDMDFFCWTVLCDKLFQFYRNFVM